MKEKKIPMRRCIATQERFEKKDLLRVVRTPEGNIVFDHTGKTNGRGAYISKSVKAIEKAKKSRVLNRHLESDIPESVYEDLLKAITDE